MAAAEAGFLPERTARRRGAAARATARDAPGPAAVAGGAE